jgi:hypothetical protein
MHTIIQMVKVTGALFFIGLMGALAVEGLFYVI